MIEEIQAEAAKRGVTRLCHFTPSRNLVHILTGRLGVLATANLEEYERALFTPTDLIRLDRHPGFVCCSIEYPNAWYLDRAMEAERLFRDWVVLLISPRHLWADGTLFSPRNAASAVGTLSAPGYDGFHALYGESVVGAGGRIFSRSQRHLTECPTDDQAEVLVPDRIGPEDLLGFAVRDVAQAKRELARLNYVADSAPPDCYVAPTLFEKYALSNAVRAGVRPNEELWGGVEYA